MKQLLTILLISCLAAGAFAQDSLGKKPSTFVLHMFYNDFKTAQQLRTNSFKNLKWSSIGNMQTGFGINYLKGITRKIDFAATLDGSYTDYLYKDGTTNGSSEFLLDANAGFNLKLLTDNHPVVPYIFAGAGYSVYKGKSGLYAPVGIGLQFNFFNEAFVLANMQYRTALSPAVNNHFQYGVGIGASLKKHNKAPKAVQAQPSAKADEIMKPVADTIIKVQVKNLRVIVIDGLTGLPLPGASVFAEGTAGELNGVSDDNGRVTFNAVKAADFTVGGRLNGINATAKLITAADFAIIADDIQISIVHNDPRFTLSGRVINKVTFGAESGVIINVVNVAKNTGADTTSNQGNGAFNIQLEPGSDFTVSGKKGGYISNIEKLSTKGLNRSATLYVRLELGMEQALPDKAIVLSNIYYDTGSSKFRAGALPDLERLVKFLQDNPALKIGIDSHTDSRGNAAKNLKLSQARALEIVNYLQKNGINKNRLTPKGYGATRLVNGCRFGVKCTEAQHEQNRRTEFKVF